MHNRCVISSEPSSFLDSTLGLSHSSSTDQRGFAMGDDLGAFQTQDAYNNPVVNTTTDDADSAGDLSLRDAVNLANVLGSSSGVNQTITFDSSLTSSGAATINLTGGAIEMDDTAGTVTIDATSATHPITVNAAGGGYAFSIDSGSVAQIAGLTIGGTVSAGGTLTLNGDINPTANNFSVEVLDGATLNLPVSTELASLTIDAGGLARQTSTDTTFGLEVLTVGSLTIHSPSGSTNGGVLDLGNGDLIVRQTDAGNIAPLLAAGYDDGWWDGASASGPNPAAIVSNGAAQDPDQIKALGSAQIGISSSTGELNLFTFDGQAVSSGDTVVALTYYGDANLDRQVNSADYSMFNASTGGATTPEEVNLVDLWTDGDFNYDGLVNYLDSSLAGETTSVLTGSKTVVELGEEGSVHLAHNSTGQFTLKETTGGAKINPPSTNVTIKVSTATPLDNSKGSGVFDCMDPLPPARTQRGLQIQRLCCSLLPSLVSIWPAALDAQPHRLQLRGGLGLVHPLDPVIRWLCRPFRHRHQPRRGFFQRPLGKAAPRPSSS